VPADKDEVEQVRKDVESESSESLDGYAGTVSIGRGCPSWADKLCLIHEISARHGTLLLILKGSNISCWYRIINFYGYILL